MESKEEYSLREMLREQNNMLHKHIEESKEFRDDVIPTLAKIQVHGQYTKEKLDSHGNEIDRLKSSHNKQKGALWAATTMGVLAIGKIFKDLFS